jgi:hypothetical protein
MSALDDVVSVAIHPAIGIARVGNSRDKFFIGPEIPGVYPVESPRAGGAFMRQAARFRVFGLDARGDVIREITTHDARIAWTVHLANKKAAWYEFNQAFDIPASMGDLPKVRPLASSLRNKGVTGDGRAALVIDPGPRTIDSAAAAKDPAQRTKRFDGGTFLGTPVDLGDASIEEDGTLVVRGGYGTSASPTNQPIVDFANNPEWYDDISDGSVDAVVQIGGRRLEAVGAWLIVGPPNFAPGITPFISGWDLVLEVMMKKGLVHRPVRPSFGEHIHPILQRLSTAQWVNSGFALEFGWGSPADFSDAALLSRLSDSDDASRSVRQAVFSLFRDPGSQTVQADRIPAVYGDAILLDPKTQDPREWMSVLNVQYDWLKQWAEGDFDPGFAPAPRNWDGLSPAERAAALDRAALEDCTGGPFHPGIEFTWPLRQPILYDDRLPFRIKRRNRAEPVLPLELTSSVALAHGGPLDGSAPGDLSRWMALPWQCDTASCLSAYEEYSGEYVPTFWPARVPNDVITGEKYKTIMDQNAPREERETAFATASRRKWLRSVSYSDWDTSKPPRTRDGPTKFVTSWHDISVVTRQAGPPDLTTLPQELWVETGRPESPQHAGIAVAQTMPLGEPSSARGSRRRSRLDR